VADDLRLPPDLEEARKILYPDLSVEDGRTRVLAILEQRAERRELIEDLFRRVRRLTEDQD